MVDENALRQVIVTLFQLQRLHNTERGNEHESRIYEDLEGGRKIQSIKILAWARFELESVNTKYKMLPLY
jgi:hypothetical protein